MELQKPIMIVCAGRSGSTMYYRLIARHKDMGWLSTWNDAVPSQVWLSLFSNLYGMRIFDKVKHSYVFPKPFSPYRFWEHYLPGIARHDRPLVPEDVPDESIEPLRRTIIKVLRHQGKSRFLMKVTGWSRMAFFDRIFPGLLFIHLKREPIAIVSSWLKAGWLNVTGDLDSENWDWGEVPDEYREIWRDLGRGGVLSAAVKTQLDIDDIRRNVAQFPGRCYELNYEDLVVEPMEYMRETLEFCSLDWSQDFEDVINSAGIRDYSDRWKQQIPSTDADRILAFFDRVAALKAPTGSETMRPSYATDTIEGVP